LLRSPIGASAVTALLRTATAQDAPGIRALLEADGLPTSDLTKAAPHFVVACDAEGRILAAGALQPFADAALVRSVVVAREARGAGLGARVVQDLERVARAAHVKELILLTQTAERFFAQQGFHVIHRQAVPRGVQQSEEFRSLCPASAMCMAKSLATSA
jgi:amino-acid N-acetyltransferase